jgi:L-asparaginase II
MLAYCVQCGHAKDDYLAFDHPLQAAIRRAVSRFTATPEEDWYLASMVVPRRTTRCRCPGWHWRSPG